MIHWGATRLPPQPLLIATIQEYVSVALCPPMMGMSPPPVGSVAFAAVAPHIARARAHAPNVACIVLRMATSPIGSRCRRQPHSAPRPGLGGSAIQNSGFTRFGARLRAPSAVGFRRDDRLHEWSSMALMSHVIHGRRGGAALTRWPRPYRRCRGEQGGGASQWLR